MTGPELRSATWPTVPRGGTVLVPVGSVEQHGPHLPLDTDSVIAAAVAARAVAVLREHHAGCFLVAPTVSYGASGEHQAFAGTSSIGTETLRQVVVELVRSLRTWAAKVVLVNGHGGNVSAVDTAVARLRAEGHDVRWVPCRTESAHAGRTETSLMLHLDPARVRLELAAAGNTRPVAALMPALVAGGVQAASPNGVLGDPTGATAADGERVLRAMVDDVVAAVALR